MCTVNLDGVGLRGGDVALVADICESSQVGEANMGRAQSVNPGEYSPCPATQRLCCDTVEGGLFAVFCLCWHMNCGRYK